jgi:MFS family permease
MLAFGAQVGGIQQLVKLVEDRTDERTAQFALTAIAGTSVVARLIGGRVVQRVPMMRLTVGLVAAQAMALVVIGFSNSTWLLFVAIILFGATIGNILMLQPLLIAERFGVRDYPRLFSRTQLVAVVGHRRRAIAARRAVRRVRLVSRCRIWWRRRVQLLGAIVLSVGGPATVAADVA